MIMVVGIGSWGMIQEPGEPNKQAGLPRRPKGTSETSSRSVEPVHETRRDHPMFLCSECCNMQLEQIEAATSLRPETAAGWGPVIFRRLPSYV